MFVSYKIYVYLYHCVGRAEMPVICYVTKPKQKIIVVSTLHLELIKRLKYIVVIKLYKYT